MTEWQKGDLALCISTPETSLGEIVKGGRYLVAEVHPERDFDGGRGLRLSDVPTFSDPSALYPDFWHEESFIKVTPPSDMKLEETSTPKEVEDA